jgi:hypothetical protein
MCGLHGLHGTAQLLRALLAERDALRDQLATARNEALEEAARVVDIEYEMHKDYRNASLLCNNDEDAQCRLISMTTCASISAAIDALKSTTPAPREVTVQEAAKAVTFEDWLEACPDDDDDTETNRDRARRVLGPRYGPWLREAWRLGMAQVEASYCYKAGADALRAIAQGEQSDV